MRCSKAQRYIDLSLDGELKQSHRQELTQHLQKCTACTNWQAQAEKLQLMLSTAPKAEFPAWVHANLMDKVHRLDNARPGFVHRFKLATATATLAVVLSFWAGAQVGIKNFTPVNEENAGQESILVSTNSIDFGENSLIESYENLGETNE